MPSNKIRVKIGGYDHSLIEAACQKIISTAGQNGARVSGPVPLPTNREVVCVIRSPHKHKDSREQFEIRTHKRLIDIYNPNARLVDILTKLEMPAGVDVQIKL
jgi:small subunit ribosomal protein S10